MKNRAKNGYNRLSYAELLAKGIFIQSQMTIHVATFATPTPTLTVLQDKIDLLSGTMSEAEAGNRVAKAERRDAAADLIANLRQLTTYVNMVANGDLTIIEKAGMAAALPPSPLPPIVSVDTPVLAPGANSSIKAKTGVVKGGKTYNFYFTTDASLPIEQWKVKSCTRIDCTIKNTDPATRYYIQVAVVGKDEQMVFSGISTIVTQ
jgi:hypothetical protein